MRRSTLPSMLDGRNAATLVGALVCACAAAPPADAYGPEGHLIAGIAAEPRLCGAARAQLDRLGDGEGLPELGLWADRIRGDRPESSPWHYMNIADGAAVRAFLHPPEGDVLEAIPRFAGMLADRALPERERAEALRFLVHFVVDIHQPLHVGRVADRGGNLIELRLSGDTTNLHRFWDTDVIALEHLSAERYAQSLSAQMQASSRAAAELDPVVWAEESLALRDAVYDFTTGAGGLDAAYIERAKAITRERLAAATLRLAAILNGIFGC